MDFYILSPLTVALNKMIWLLSDIMRDVLQHTQSVCVFFCKSEKPAGLTNIWSISLYFSESMKSVFSRYVFVVLWYQFKSENTLWLQRYYELWCISCLLSLTLAHRKVTHSLLISSDKQVVCFEKLCRQQFWITYWVFSWVQLN